LYYAPFWPFPNGFNTPTTSITVFGRIDFPEQLVYAYIPKYHEILVGCPHTADLTFMLYGDEIVSGRVLHVQITTIACPTLLNNTSGFIVRMDDALEGGSPTVWPTAALVVMDYTEHGWQHGYDWIGNHDILYSVSGTFTATVLFELHNGTELEIPTGAIIPIQSLDVITARQNEALTTSLTFFVLMFAAIEVKVKTRKDYSNYD
jgi:hypothetical protein